MGGSFGSLALAALLAPQSLTLHWTRYPNGTWCWLLTAPISIPPRLEGVYVIWRAADGAVVRIGQGAIADRLRAHRGDRDVFMHGQSGPLLVTWAPVISAYRDGVERYLAEIYRPLVGSAFPNAAPIAVNLPGASLPASLF